MRPIALSLLSLLLTFGAAHAQKSVAPAPGPLEKAAAGIRPEAFAAHMRFLADDKLEGRGTGTRGYDIAAAYVASQFEGLGLTPAGEAGGWLQQVPFRRLTLRAEDCALSLVTGGRERKFTLGDDFVMSGDWRHERTSVSAALVFVGFGVTAPELNYDDYAGVDVRGKVVVMLSGAPRNFPNDQRALYSWNQTKENNAAARGAIGILSFRTPEDSLRAAWPRVMRQTKLPSYRWLDRSGEPHDTHASFVIGGVANRSLVDAMFAGAPATPLEIFAMAGQGRSKSFDLKPTLRARRATRQQIAQSPNVVAMLPGSDPALKHERVVVSAHLDHLGISAPVEGDSINNGAFDNATGIAAMIEIARALKTMPRAPKRSIVFLAVTGEEKGLQGADYFAQAPTFTDPIVADINLDMLVMIHPFTRVIAFGAEHSSLQAAVERAARASGIRTMPDPNPEEVVFVRSDQFPFVRRGIPAVFPVCGPATPEEEKAEEHWRREIYHTPQDQMSQPMDFAAGAAFTRFNLRLLVDVANAPKAPTWNPGDYFGKTFGRAKQGGGTAPTTSEN